MFDSTLHSPCPSPTPMNTHSPKMFTLFYQPYPWQFTHLNMLYLPGIPTDSSYYPHYPRDSHPWKVSKRLLNKTIEPHNRILDDVLRNKFIYLFVFNACILVCLKAAKFRQYLRFPVYKPYCLVYKLRLNGQYSMCTYCLRSGQIYLKIKHGHLAKNSNCIKI